MKSNQFLYFISFICLFGCTQESATDFKLKAYKNEFDKLEEKLYDFKLKSTDKLLLLPFSFTALSLEKDKEKIFQLRDKKSIKELLLFLNNHKIKEYSTEKILFGDYVMEFGDANDILYYLNTNWKKDSVCFVPEGFQYYIPLGKIEWEFLFKDFNEVYSKKYSVKNIEQTRNVFYYASINNFIVRHIIEEDAPFSRYSDLWIKYDRCFQYTIKAEKEDILENREKLRVKKLYPEYKYDMKYCWGSFMKDEINYGVNIYCNEDFYRLLSNDGVKGKWSKWKGYLEVLSDSNSLIKVDSVYNFHN